MQPVVSMTKWTYFAFWAVVWLVTMVTIHFSVRYAVRWGVEHGMARFVEQDRK